MSGSSSTMSILGMLSGRVLSAPIVSQREHQCKRAAPSGGALDLHVAPVGLHDVLDEREPETAALGVVHQAVLGAVELVEDLLVLALGHADPVVGHREAHGVAVPPGRHP